MSSGDWLYETFVPGVAVPFAGQGPEQVWRAALVEHVRPAGSAPVHYGVSADFFLSPGRDPDLDNLLAPLFSVVVNKLGWFAGRRPNNALVPGDQGLCERWGARGPPADQSRRSPAAYAIKSGPTSKR